MNHFNKTALNMGKLWTKDGRLVATVVQEALSDPEPLKNSKI
jgi:acyl-CoA thioesterase